MGSMLESSKTASVRLFGGLFLVYATIYVALSAVSVIYLPTRVAEFAPDDKVAVLAIVSTAASLVVMVGQPIIGALSDRTSGRLGRRAPWMLAGALAAAVLIPVLGMVEGVVAVAVVWALCELSLNTIQAPASAVTVDRVPVRRRGLVSGVTGAGFLVGSAIGSVVMGSVLFGSDAGVWAICAVPLVGVLVFVLLNPERRAAAPRLAAPGWRARLAGFVVNPRVHPDFWWTFVSRGLMTLAQSILVTYLLYIAQDYLGLPADRAAALAGLVVVVLLGASLPSLFIGGIVSDRTGRRKVVLVVASLIMAASLLIPLLAPSVPSMLVFAAVFGLGFGAFSSVGKALSTLVLTDADRHAGKDLGILNIAATLPQVLAPGVAWAIVAATGGYAGLFAASLVLSLLAGGAILFVRSVR